MISSSWTGKVGRDCCKQEQVRVEQVLVRVEQVLVHVEQVLVSDEQGYLYYVGMSSSETMIRMFQPEIPKGFLCELVVDPDERSGCGLQTYLVGSF